MNNNTREPQSISEIDRKDNQHDNGRNNTIIVAVLVAAAIASIFLYSLVISSDDPLKDVPAVDLTMSPDTGPDRNADDAYAEEAADDFRDELSDKADATTQDEATDDNAAPDAPDADAEHATPDTHETEAQQEPGDAPDKHTETDAAAAG